MNETITTFWKELSDENKSMVKAIALAAVVIYVLLQLATLFIPLSITAGAVYWAYITFIDQNPKILK